MRRLCLYFCTLGLALSADRPGLAKDFLLRLEIKSETETTINDGKPVRGSDIKVLDLVVTPERRFYGKMLWGNEYVLAIGELHQTEKGEFKVEIKFGHFQKTAIDGVENQTSVSSPLVSVELGEPLALARIGGGSASATPDETRRTKIESTLQITLISEDSLDFPVAARQPALNTNLIPEFGALDEQMRNLMTAFQGLRGSGRDDDAEKLKAEIELLRQKIGRALADKRREHHVLQEQADRVEAEALEMEQAFSRRQLRVRAAVFEVDHRKLEPHQQAKLAKLLGRKPAEQPDSKVQRAGFQVPKATPALQERFISFVSHDIVGAGELARLEQEGVVKELGTQILRATDRSSCGWGMGWDFGEFEKLSVPNSEVLQPVPEGGVRENVERAGEGARLNIVPTILPRGRVRLALNLEIRSAVLDRVVDKAGHPLPAIGSVKYKGETTVRPGRHVVLSGIGHPAPVRTQPNVADEKDESEPGPGRDQAIAMQRELIVILTPEILDPDN